MRFVALFRGINVGGRTSVKMERLREVFEKIGFSGVKSYIQSGNVAFDSDRDETECRQVIEEAFEREFFRTEVMFRPIETIARLIDSNPFADEEFDDKQMHLVFLAFPMDDEKSAILVSHNRPDESFVVRGREVYCLLRNGVADSLLGKKFIDNKLKIPATARNWRTVRTIASL